MGSNAKSRKAVIMRNLYGWAIAAVTLSLVSLCLGIAPPNSNWSLAGAAILLCAAVLTVVVAFGCLKIDPILPPGARPALIVGFVLAVASIALEVRYALTVFGTIHGRGWNPVALTLVAIILMLHSQGKLYGPLTSKPTFMRQ
jgi:hypothetical protein